MSRERLQNLLARRLQAVDPQIDGRALGQRFALLGRALAESLIEHGMEPFRIIAPHPGGSASQIAVPKASHFFGRQAGGREALAAAISGDLMQGRVPAVLERRQHDGAGFAASHQIGERLFPPQAVEDEIADKAAVA